MNLGTSSGWSKGLTGDSPNQRLFQRKTHLPFYFYCLSFIAMVGSQSMAPFKNYKVKAIFTLTIFHSHCLRSGQVVFQRLNDAWRCPCYDGECKVWKRSEDSYLQLSQTSESVEMSNNAAPFTNFFCFKATSLKNVIYVKI